MAGRRELILVLSACIPVPVFLNSSSTKSEDQGIGLGLAISQRLAGLLGIELKVRSVFGQGSCFAVNVELGAANPVLERLGAKSGFQDAVNFENKLNILYLDNEKQILSAMRELLEDWNCKVETVSNRQELDEVLDSGYQPVLIFADYHLDHGDNGIDVLDDYYTQYQANCVIISADHSADLQALADARGYKLLLKPVDPASLRTILESTKQENSLSGEHKILAAS